MVLRNARSAIAVGVLTAAGVVAAPGTAWAVGGTVQLNGGVLAITVDSGGDRVYLGDFGTSVRIGSDKGQTLVGGGACSQLNSLVVDCPKSAATSYTLVGSDSRDVVLANTMPLPGTVDLGGGNDYLQSGRGADLIKGGPGLDELSYDQRTTSVIVDFDDEANDGSGEGDNIANDIERIFGGQGDDYFQADARATQFYGMAGDDTFFTSTGGAKRYDGGPGTDEFRGYSTGPVNLSLDDVANDGPAGQNDNLVGMETLRGSPKADTITGDDGPNLLIGEGSGGADILRGLGGNDILYAQANFSSLDGGAGDDDLRAIFGTSKQLIGGTGTDLVTYFGHTDDSGGVYKNSPVTVSINGVADDGGAGQKDNVHTDVENLAGTYHDDDQLTGSSGPNVLIGFGGDDVLNGSGGDDVLLTEETFAQPMTTDKDVVSGGAGRDLVSYAGTTAAVNVSIDNVANDGPAGDTDNVKSDVEQVRGGSGNDTLSGSGAANTLFGGPGDDTLRGNGGADRLEGEAGGDTLVGGLGADTISYGDRTADVRVSLNGSADDGEAGEHDNVAADIETIEGGEGDDDLRGSSGVNRLRGGNGDDRVSGGAGNDLLDLGYGDDVVDAGSVKDGADKILGGPGVDTVDYRQRTAALTVTINGSGGDGEGGENDTVSIDVETVIGGAGGDKITGGAADNTLVGNGGNDVLKGLDGNDVIDPGLGADEILGGTGTDTADYGDRTADLFLTPDDLALDGESGEKDQIRPDVENYIGGSGDDYVIGNFLDNVVHGGGGADNITGGSGNDTLYGEGGNDTLEGEGGTDFADGGLGTDTCLTAESTAGCELFS